MNLPEIIGIAKLRHPINKARLIYFVIKSQCCFNCERNASNIKHFNPPPYNILSTSQENARSVFSFRIIPLGICPKKKRNPMLQVF